MNFFNTPRSKKSSLKTAAIIAVTLLACSYSHAQSDLRVSVGPQLYFAELALESSVIESSFEPGLGVVGGISIGLGDQWSIHSGIGLNYYQSRNGLSNYSDTQDTVDISGENFEFRYNVTNYSEIQKMTALSIPLAIQYESSGSFRLYTKLGVEANFFVNESSEARTVNLNTSGYFPRFNAVLDAPRFAGFGTFQDQQFSTSTLDLKTSFNATFELGLKQLYDSGDAIYIGGFFKYGLNDISNSDGANGLVSFDPSNPTAFRSTSVINAVNSPNNGADRIVSEAKLHVFGLALRYEFNL